MGIEGQLGFGEAKSYMQIFSCIGGGLSSPNPRVVEGSI